jgi:hypothetical protein
MGEMLALLIEEASPRLTVRSVDLELGIKLDRKVDAERDELETPHAGSRGLQRARNGGH